MFEQACQPPAIAPAPDLQEWQTSAEALLADRLGLRLAPQRRVRTQNLGQAKTNRWATCASETLIRLPGAEQPWLLLRPPPANHPSRAAIDLAKAAPELVEKVRRNAEGSGLQVRITSARTLIVERPVPEASDWSFASRFEEQAPHLLAVGAAALLLKNWWNELMSRPGTAARE